MSTDADALKEYAEAGVDLPELKEVEKEEPETKVEEKTEESPKVETEKDEEESEADKEETTPEEPQEPQKKRSIFQEYKEKKAEARTEKERADAAEAKVLELQTLLESSKDAKTPEEKQEAQDELDVFARENDMDPEKFRKMRDLILKGIPNKKDDGLSTETAKKIEEFMSANSKAIATQEFEKEFKSSLPSLKEIFPKASDAEMEVIKTKLDSLAHSTEWHDKPLDFIAFKHREQLAALTSPKKRGMEKKGRIDGEAIELDFDPTKYPTDPTAQVEWEKKYNALMARGEGVETDSQGRKILI